MNMDDGSCGRLLSWMDIWTWMVEHMVDHIVDHLTR